MATFGAINSTSNVSVMAATVAATNQGADIGATTLTSTAGRYLVTYYMDVTTADAAATAVTSISITWTDGSTTARTFTSATLAMTALSLTQVSGSIVVQLASGNLQYSTSHTGASYGTAKYALYINATQLA